MIRITPEEIRKVAEDVFVTEKINLAVVGPVKEEEKDRLEKLLVV